jgi:hypothetical protein
MGAPKGNTNALKHGLYAKHFSPEEQAGLRKMPPEDYRHEIYMMRVAVKNVFEIHANLHKYMETVQNSARHEDIEELSKITNSLALAVTALGTMARTHALFSGTDTELEDAFDQALNSLPIFLDDKYLTETNEEVEGKGEILVDVK